jgi:hypothetical protein
VVQRKGESPREFIQCFCNKRNIIPEVNDKSIIMFFKKELRDSSLIRKLAMKIPRASEEMLAVTNKYALVEEATLDTREQKKDKELGHSDQPSTSKSHDKKRKLGHSMANMEQPCRYKEYRPRPSEFQGFLDRIYIFHPQGKHKTQDYDQLQGSRDEVLKTTKKADQEKKPKDPKGDFPEAHKEVNYIYGGPNYYESRRKQKLTAREVMAISLTAPEYLKWTKVPITFDHSEHLDFVPKPGRYPLIVSPIVKDVKFNRVLVDDGSSLNILFLNTFDQMGLSRYGLHPSWAPFHGIVPGAAATPIGQITLPVTFGTQENFRIEHMHFEVTNFEIAYNAFLGRLALTKFMAIPHYTYLVLKMPGLHGVTSIRGDVKHTYDFDKESYETADRLTASVELQELKKALVESPWTRSCPRPRNPRCPSSQRTHSARLS